MRLDVGGADDLAPHLAIVHDLPKARDLMGPVLGAQRTEAVIKAFNGLDQVPDVSVLVRSLLTT